MQPEGSTTGPTLTHCPYCALNCGLGLQSSETSEPTTGESVSLVRWKGSPLTGGKLCSKGATAHLQVRHDDRLRMPLLRSGTDFHEIGWEDAFDRVASGFASIAKRHGAAANAVLSGGSLTNEKVYLIGKFARLALQTPHIDYNGRFCMTSAGAANKMAFGADRMMTPLSEINRAEVVVVVGANISAAFPVTLPGLLQGVRDRGGRVVVIDPRAAKFVKPEDLHISPRPGTDGVLFNGLLRQIVVDGFVDQKFIRTRTKGFAGAVEVASECTPDKVEEVADVSPYDLRELARVIGSVDRVMWLHGRGPEQQVGGVLNVSSIINVGLACGHAGRPGCGINMLTGQRNGQGGREWGQRCNQLPAGRDIDNPAHRAVVAERWGVDPAQLPHSGKTYVEILQMAQRREVKGLFVFGTNMSVSAPDLHAVKTQMDALDHTVVVDPFFSESARHADIVLPGTTFAEEEGTITTIEGRVVRIDQAVEPLPQFDDMAILSELAARLDAGHHFQFETGRQVFEEMRAVSAGGPVDYAGMTWERLRDEDGVFWPCPDEAHPGTPQLYLERFHHLDGLARFEPVVPRLPRRIVDAEFPLVLTNGRVLAQFLSGNQTMRIERQNRAASEPVLEVHPDTAERLSLVEGEQVEITAALGTSRVAWTLNDRLRPDTVFLPYHWVECNRLVEADLDPVSKIPGFKYTPVAVSPVTPATHSDQSEQPFELAEIS